MGLPWEMAMLFFSGNLDVERTPESVVVRSRRGIGIRMVAALGCAIGLLFFWAAITDTAAARNDFSYWYHFLFATVIVCATLPGTGPCMVTTVFDLRSRRMRRNSDFAWGWYRRHRSYAFTEISGVGIKKEPGEALYMPVIVKTDGGMVRLASDLGSTELRYARAIEAICAATGLPKIDVSRRRWWKFW